MNSSDQILFGRVRSLVCANRDLFPAGPVGAPGAPGAAGATGAGETGPTGPTGSSFTVPAEAGLITYTDGNSGITGSADFTYRTMGPTGATGTFTSNMVSADIVGHDTRFIDDLLVNGLFISQSHGLYGTISSITSQTSLTLDGLATQTEINGTFLTNEKNIVQLKGDFFCRPNLIGIHLGTLNIFGAI
jgi:hypothetical protein